MLSRVFREYKRATLDINVRSCHWQWFIQKNNLIIGNNTKQKWQAFSLCWKRVQGSWCLNFPNLLYCFCIQNKFAGKQYFGRPNSLFPKSLHRCQNRTRSTPDWRRSVKIGVDRNFAKFHRKTPLLGSHFNKVADLKACNFILKRLQQKCFRVKFAEFLRTPNLRVMSKQLLQKWINRVAIHAMTWNKNVFEVLVS